MSAARIETYTLPAGSTSQVSLFPAAPIAGNDDPQTSVDAGEAFAPTGGYSVLQQRILDAFHDRTIYGYTVDELTLELTPWYQQQRGVDPDPRTVGKRVTELKQSGDLIEGQSPDGTPETRPSNRRKPMTVWRLAPQTAAGADLT